MAKIITEHIVVKLSKLVKETQNDDAPLTNKDFSANLEAVLQELVGESVIVEIEKE